MRHEADDELIQGAPTAGGGVPLWAQRLLVVYFGLALALVPLTQVLVERGRGEPVGALSVLHRPPTVANLTAYERALEKDSVVATAVRQYLQWLGLVALRIGNRKGRVAPGLDADFLLLTPDLELRSTWIGGAKVYSA